MADMVDNAGSGALVPTEVLPPGSALAVLGEAGRDRWPLLVQLWLDSGFSANTREAYTRVLREWEQVCDRWGVHPLAVTRPHVDRWLRELETTGGRDGTGQASTTRARKVATLASLYGYLATEGVIDLSPVANVRRTKTTDRHQAPGLSEAEALLLIEAAEADGLRTAALVRLLLTNVLRISEALAADVEDLGHERGHRTLDIMGKGSKAARVPLPAAVADAIDTYLGDRTSGPLFATSSGKRLDRAAVWRTLRRLAMRAGIDLKISPHSLRATGITVFMDRGGTLRDAQQLARHANSKTTEVYDRRRLDLDDHGAHALGRAFARKG